MKSVVIAIAFFLLGSSIASVPAMPEERVAISDALVESTQPVSFDAIKVYPDEVIIEYPGLRYAKINSNSMAPVITDKSVVFEKVPASADEIQVGDIISFYEPSVDSVVLHLVVDIVEQNETVYYSTKGVANEETDEWLVPFENVKGIMVGTFR